MTIFSKDAASLDQQIETLISRGLEITKPERARHYLSNISYFRMSAYTRPFYIPATPDTIEHHFIPGTTFDDALNLYVFDRELRLLLLDAIERIEVALRAQLTQTLATKYGPFGYLDAQIFDTRYNHDWLLNELEKKVNSRDAEVFLNSYRRKYPDSPEHPPLWMALELLSFRQISTLFAKLRNSEDQKQISNHFGFRFAVLKSWFRALSDLRNHCAHHARVWNREFGTSPVWPHKTPKHWIYVPDHISVPSHPEQSINPRRRLYFQLVIIETLLKKVSPTSQWADKLKTLLDKNPTLSQVHMGIPSDWKEEQFWQEK